MSAVGESEVVATKSLTDRCLWIYRKEQWDEVLKSIEARPSYAEATRLKYALLGHAHDVPFDKVGRVLVPQRLRDLVGLGDKVVWVGMDRRIELWAKDAWDAKQKALEAMVIDDAMLDGLPL